MNAAIPAEYLPLLIDPNYGFLGTVRPDHTVQVSPMWFEYDGENIRFSHTTTRAKYRNLQHNPSMSLAIRHPDRPSRYVELRGRLIEVIPDPEGAFYIRLGRRFGTPDQQPPQDSADRVVLVMNVERVIGVWQAR